MNAPTAIQNLTKSLVANTEPDLETVTYTPFAPELSPITMNVWRGSEVALLTPADNLDRYDPSVLPHIAGTLDRAWDFYAEITGREPDPLKEIDGLTTIAVVPKTCGAGCGYLGVTGIEIQEDPYFDVWLHDTVATTDQFDQTLFYELGRNFWFYGDQLRPLPTDAATAYAIANRFLSMDAIGIEGAPYNRYLPFEEFRTSIMDDMSQIYFADTSRDWSNTILTQSVPDNSQWGANDLLASLFGRVYEDFGEEVYSKMWQAIGDASATSNAEDATNLFISSASSASGIDYSFLLKGAEWHFTVGGRGDDVLTAPTVEPGQKSVVHGFGGNDFIRGTKGDDLLFGGSGQDTLRGGAGNDTEVGGSGDDRIFGGKGRDRLYGGAGNDFLDGGKGDDLIDGGTGHNALLGGAGKDIFTVRSGAYNFLCDFKVCIDRISLDGLSFSDLSFSQGTGDVAADAFISVGSDAIAQIAHTTVAEINNSANFV